MRPFMKSFSLAAGPSSDYVHTIHHLTRVAVLCVGTSR